MKEKRKIFHSLFFPLLFILIIWCIKVLEISLDMSFATFGVYPLKSFGLIGIFTAPLIHADWKHLTNNSVPLLILSFATFYFYRPLGYRVFFLTWIITGIWVWCGAREAYHIGASGIVYGLASFLFFSGAIRGIPGLAAISLIVVFLYGSMIWGIFPFIPDISWESHLSGGVAGLILSIFFKKQGPQRKKYDWEIEPDEPYPVSNEDKILLELANEPKDEEKSVETNERPDAKIIYIYKDTENKDKID